MKNCKKTLYLYNDKRVLFDGSVRSAIDENEALGIIIDVKGQIVTVKGKLGTLKVSLSNCYVVEWNNAD